MQAKWIDVKERLPKEHETINGRVSVIDEDGYLVIGCVFSGVLMCDTVTPVKWLLLEDE
jgi:hypothetical protein